MCRAAFALCLQAAYELGNFTDLDALVLKYFSSFSSLPFEMLLLWYADRLRRAATASNGRHAHTVCACCLMMPRDGALRAA